MRIAVVGSGISGLSAAWLLSCDHEVVLFESAATLGGHTNTVDVSSGGVTHPVDTGFLVFNEATYPNLIQLFDALGVRTTATEMSFSVGVEDIGFEWAGTDLNTVFAQRRNLVNPRMWWLLRDLLRFNRETTALHRKGSVPLGSLGDYLTAGGYGAPFRDWYLVPMAAAIWSTPPAEILSYPLATFIRFCHNHGLLQVLDRPGWRTVVGGGREYVRRMATGISDVRLSARVAGITRDADGVQLTLAGGPSERFDHCVLACHSDQQLAMLRDADADERAILGAVRYQPNQAILHTDVSFLPRQRRAWAAWNYRVARSGQVDSAASVSYLINRLQPLPFHTPVVVSLNPQREPDPRTVLGRYDYEHPLFDQAAIEAQRRLPEIQGRRRTWYCGAWTRYGFHEDGLLSGIRVATGLGCLTPWAVTTV